MTSIYGSLSAAHQTVFEYRQILNSQSHLIDGTVIPERTVVVDQNTYNSLAPANRKLIDAYEYYEEQNNLKRNIKLLDKRYLGSILTEVETIFSSS